MTIPEWGWLLFVGVDAEKMVQTRNEFLLKAVVVFGVVSILGWLLLGAYGQFGGEAASGTLRSRRGHQHRKLVRRSATHGPQG